jgi:hypothetical protein
VEEGGDFLLEIFHSPFCMFNDGPSTEWNLSGYGRVPDMLLHDSEDASDFKGYDPKRGTNIDSISYLLQLTRDVKRDRARLTYLLVQIAKADLKYALVDKNPLCAVDLRNIIEVVKTYCLGEDEISHIRYSYDLAAVLTKWRDILAGGWDPLQLMENVIREKIEPDELTKRCTEVIHTLLSPKVTRFGLRASRSIACARPIVAADAATGWLRMDDDRTGFIELEHSLEKPNYDNFSYFV